MTADKHTYEGKRRLCSTDICNFTDIQGIGNDPMYRRYASVKSIIDRVVPAHLHGFLAAPHYSEADDAINWYVDDWGDDAPPVRLADLGGEEAADYRRVLDDTVRAYRAGTAAVSGEELKVMGDALRYVNEEFVYCRDGRVYLVAWGMTPDANKHLTIGQLIHGGPRPAEHVEAVETRHVASEPENAPAPIDPPKPPTPEPPAPPAPPAEKPRKRGFWRWWMWLILAALLTPLLLWLLSYLFPGCSAGLAGCMGCGHELNGVVAADDDALAGAPVTDIELVDGKLPEGIVPSPPMHGDDGEALPVITDPNLPPVIANRLLLLLEDDNDNVDALARDFKRAYPGEEYMIIDFDREVKCITVQIPEAERARIREELPGKVGHNVIVVDDTMYELSHGQTSRATASDAGWHLRAINAPGGWAITKGNPKVRVAVVDDGIDAAHPMFAGRIVDAYNIYTGNNHLSAGSGHGTHVAGLAVGGHQMLGRGAAGIAPECMLIPVQVMENGQTSLSGLVKGLMYAVHKGADVVNLSIGPEFSELHNLPIARQIEVVREHFANEAKLFDRIFRLAARKNTVIVLAAGNDCILSLIIPENRSDNAIVVGAVDQRIVPSEFSNFGPGTDVSAPGTSIYSSVPGGGLDFMDGTSMAAPIITGTVALMKTLKKDITARQAANVIYRTGRTVNGPLPPMVLLPEALRGVQSGDFSAGPERQLKPLPDDVFNSLPPTEQDNIMIIDTPELLNPITEVIETPGTDIVYPAPGPGTGTDLITGPVVDAPGADAPATDVKPSKQPAENYDDLLRRIQEAQKRLNNLIDQLPADHPARKKFKKNDSTI